MKLDYLEEFGRDVADGYASEIGEEGEHPALALVVVREQPELLAAPRAEVQHLQPGTRRLPTSDRRLREGQPLGPGIVAPPRHVGSAHPRSLLVAVAALLLRGWRTR